MPTTVVTNAYIRYINLCRLNKQLRFFLQVAASKPTVLITALIT